MHNPKSDLEFYAPSLQYLWISELLSLKFQICGWKTSRCNLAQFEASNCAMQFYAQLGQYYGSTCALQDAQESLSHISHTNTDAPNSFTFLYQNDTLRFIWIICRTRCTEIFIKYRWAHAPNSSTSFWDTVMHRDMYHMPNMPMRSMYHMYKTLLMHFLFQSDAHRYVSYVW